MLRTYLFVEGRKWNDTDSSENAGIMLCTQLSRIEMLERMTSVVEEVPLNKKYPMKGRFYWSRVC